MNAALEEKFRRWAKPPSDTETEKCERAVRMIKQALDADPTLSQMNLTVFGKGSFHNRTNIPSESDVDVGVLKNDMFYNTYPDGMSDSDFHFVDSTYTYSQFKNDVARALSNYFGSDGVSVGSKAIKVHSNTARVDADVVPHAIHRWYHTKDNYEEGVALWSSGRIVNWPQHDYDNGVAKNEQTGKRYKAIVRIVKNLRSEMEETGYASAKGFPSYLISCLIWNVPNELFSDENYTTNVTKCLDYLVGQTAISSNVAEWGEVNEHKYLFRPTQPWSLQQAHQFLRDAREYLRNLGI